MPYFQHIHGKIYYEVKPNLQGHYLICLHGWGTNMALWDHAGTYLKNWGLIKLDLPGMGLSDYRISLENQYLLKAGQIILALLDELKIKKLFLLGHSIGGMIACLIASWRTPQSLILDSTPLLGEQGVTPKVKLFAMPKPIRVPLMASLQYSSITKRLLKNTIEDIKILPNSIFENLAKGFQEANRLALYESLKDSLLFSALDSLKSFDFPVSYIIGENNKTLDINKMAQALRQACPKSKIVSFPKIRHYPVLEIPLQYYQNVAAFLEKAI